MLEPLGQCLHSGDKKPLTQKTFIAGATGEFAAFAFVAFENLSPERLGIAMGIAARFVVRHDLSEDEAAQVQLTWPFTGVSRVKAALWL